MSKCKFYLALLLMLPIYSHATTPTEVHDQVSIVIAQIKALKTKLANDKSVRQPGIQIGKTPLHVYAKGLELLEKINRFQIQEKLTALEVPQLPSKAVTPADVLKIMQFAESEVAKLSNKHKITVDLSLVVASTQPRTPSDVYQKIWAASYLMDSLIAPITPADVLRNVKMIEISIINIAKKQGKQLSFTTPKTYSDKKPADVSIQLYSLLYKLARIERQLAIKPILVVPSFPAGNIKPEDVYDVTGNVLADLTRIALNQKIASTKRLPISNRKISPNDVYSLAESLNLTALQLLN